MTKIQEHALHSCKMYLPFHPTTWNSITDTDEKTLKISQNQSNPTIWCHITKAVVKPSYYSWCQEVCIPNMTFLSKVLNIATLEFFLITQTNHTKYNNYIYIYIQSNTMFFCTISGNKFWSLWPSSAWCNTKFKMPATCSVHKFQVRWGSIYTSVRIC